MEYKKKADFDALISNTDKSVLNYFTIDDENNLIIAKWTHTVVKVNGDYPEGVDASERETPKDEYLITTEKISYSEHVKNM